MFAKLGDTRRVDMDQIWNDALNACEWDEMLGLTRIAAAAGNLTPKPWTT